MAKFIEVEFSDGSKWHIPASRVAEERAEYYARLDSQRGDGTYEDVYKAEIKHALSDNFELFDWAANNMNWEDVEAWASRVDEPAPDADYASEWANAKRCMVQL